VSHLFISHSTKDAAEIAEALAGALENAGFRCWVAPRDVKPGLTYPAQIVKAIRESDGLVLLVTPGANDSPDVLQEVQRAHIERKTIAPVIVAGANASDDLDFFISVRHQIPWTDAGGTAASLARVFSPPAAPTQPTGREQPPTAPDPPRKPGEVWRDVIPGLPDSAAPEMVMLPPGSFIMGAPHNEWGATDAEQPQHEVRFVRAPALGKYPVTFAEWDAALASGAELTRPDDEGWGRDRRPVLNVSWHDAQAYLAWLNDKLRLTGQPNAYRLPSEAEWEYACRAGTTTPYFFGETIATTQATFDRRDIAALGKRSEHLEKTTLVGSYTANSFGLHDMHGNVWEWCDDCWNASYHGAPVDGSVWTQGDCASRVVRGGSWRSLTRGERSAYVRSAYRGRSACEQRSHNSGFRLARSLSTP
jgi:formylglycine-generating enzyme required for sulfatase activity